MKTETVPKQQLYSKYGDPYYVAEFRLFSFNKCKSTCQNCYYQKTKNNYYDFKQPYHLAQELFKNNYHLETLYLLPTDIFENTDNYKVLDDDNFIKCARIFDYIGLASTLQHGADPLFFDKFWQALPQQKIELHLNLLEEKLWQSDYRDWLRNEILNLKNNFQDKILINLALNVGTQFTAEQLQYITQTVSDLSEDGIIELNFTFMYNDQIPQLKKAQLLQSGYPLIQYFSKVYGQIERPINERTALRKPSFTFKENKIFVSPILPFDEYVFLNQKKYQLSEPTFAAFLDTHTSIEQQNRPILNYCNTCHQLPTCAGKQFFSLANDLALNCFKGYSDDSL